MQILYLLIIGIIAGFLAGLIMKGRGYGWIINLLLGIFGSFIGGWLLGLVNISLGNGMLGSLITATIGAVALIFIVNLLKRES